MKQIILNEEEARAVVEVLMGAGWMKLELQKLIYELIIRMQKELDN